MLLKKEMSFVLAASLVFGILAGCGKTDQTSSSASGGTGQVIKIATQSPLSGSSATSGEAIELGAKLKVEDAKEEFKKLGYDLQFVPYDDQGDPKKGAANAQLIASDAQILGVVGHLNSGVAIPSSEVYEKNNIVMVSPSNTATAVTDRGLKTVNRICARDDFQGPAGADYAMKTLNAKKIFVIDDKTAYGSGLAKEFGDAVKKNGGTLAGTESITVGEKDFSGVLNKVKASNADLIFFGGLYAEGGLIVKQARDKGITAPILGGDAIDSKSMVDIAGTSIVDTYFTSVAADVTKTAEGKKFADAYKQKFNKDVEGYSAYGYDSAGVLLQGLKDAIAANGNKLPSRQQVAESVRKIQDYQGVVTKVGFDSKGDNKFAKVYIYKFDGAKYPGVQQGEIEKK